MRLTGGFNGDYDPTFSPDRTRIAFDSYRADPTSFYEEVYVMNADGTGQTRLTNNKTSDFRAIWSPDGTRLIFVARDDATGEIEIYRVNAAGGGLLNLTQTRGGEYIGEWVAPASQRD